MTGKTSLTKAASSDHETEIALKRERTAERSQRELWLENWGI